MDGKRGLEKELFSSKYDFQETKKEWREFCKIEDTIPIYQKDWYWDAVCEHPDDWWVIVIREKEKITAAFPFVYAKRKGMYLIETPWQVPASGIWMKKIEGNNKEKELRHMQHIVEKVISLLPRYDRFKVIFNASFWTWQPFLWEGFESIPFYTMVIKGIDVENVKASITKARRERVNRGERKYVIKTDKMLFDDYWRFFEQSYNDRGKILTYEKERLKKLFLALQEHHAMQLRAVYDGETVVAVNIVLFDTMRFYNQFGTQMSGENADATSYAVYDAICEAMRQEKIYDFEGSMIQGVCEFNSSFNPKWETHYCIMNYSRKYRILNSIRGIIKQIGGSE